MTRRATEASLAKLPTALVRRLISPLTRSRGFVDQIVRQWACGNAVKARRSSPASSSMAGRCR